MCTLPKWGGMTDDMLQDSDIKKALADAGFEIFRVGDGDVHLAERVRENLLMEARIKVGVRQVSFSTRARRGDFPGDASEALFDRARSLGQAARAHGYTEATTYVIDMPDPSNPSRTLDAWYEVEFVKRIEGIDEAIAEARFMLAQVRKAKRR